MLPYIGSGDYCFSNSLHMSLLGSGVPAESLPSTGFLECLTTLPFGYTYLKGEPSSRKLMIERTLPNIRANLQQELWKPGMFGGITALRMLAQTFHTQVPDSLAVHLFYFALPLGLRHKVDAQLFLEERLLAVCQSW